MLGKGSGWIQAQGLIHQDCTCTIQPASGPTVKPPLSSTWEKLSHWCWECWEFLQDSFSQQRSQGWWLSRLLDLCQSNLNLSLNHLLPSSISSKPLQQQQQHCPSSYPSTAVTMGAHVPLPSRHLRTRLAVTGSIYDTEQNLLLSSQRPLFIYQTGQRTCPPQREERQWCGMDFSEATFDGEWKIYADKKVWEQVTCPSFIASGCALCH